MRALAAEIGAELDMRSDNLGVTFRLTVPQALVANARTPESAAGSPPHSSAMIAATGAWRCGRQSFCVFPNSLSHWLFWPGVVLIVWGELTPNPPNLGGIFGWDKLEHFTAYFGLAGMATW